MLDKSPVIFQEVIKNPQDYPWMVYKTEKGEYVIRYYKYPLVNSYYFRARFVNKEDALACIKSKFRMYFVYFDRKNNSYFVNTQFNLINLDSSYKLYGMYFSEEDASKIAVSQNMLIKNKTKPSIKNMSLVMKWISDGESVYRRPIYQNVLCPKNDDWKQFDPTKDLYSDDYEYQKLSLLDKKRYYEVSFIMLENSEEIIQKIINKKLGAKIIHGTLKVNHVIDEHAYTQCYGGIT